MENITIEEFEKSHLARIQTAKQAYWENGSWRLEDGTVYTMNEAEGIKSTAKFKEQIIPLDVTPREISWEQKEPEEMTIRELREYISVLERQHQPTARQWCEIYMRISIPLASFFFAYDRCSVRHSETKNKFFYWPWYQYYRNLYLLC